MSTTTTNTTTRQRAVGTPYRPRLSSDALRWHSLAWWRIARGYTQQRLAERAGMTQAAVARLERCHHAPRLESAEKLARALEVTLEEIRWQAGLYPVRGGGATGAVVTQPATETTQTTATTELELEEQWPPLALPAKRS